MKAVIVSAGRWEIGAIATPEPAPDQVLIRVRASGICRNDLRQHNGTPGHEPAGDIVAIGSAVRNRRVGDRVGVMLWQSSCGRCEWCARGKSLFCGEIVGMSMQLPGSHAEFVCAYADATVLLPDALSYEQAATVFCAGYTAYAGLRAGDPRPGDRVAVVGIGGLGHMALQYAKASGFHTIALTHSPDKDILIRELGADEIVRSGKELASIGGADVVLGTSASTAMQADAIQGLRPEGRLVVMGVESTPLTVPVGELIMKRATIIGSQHNDRAHLHEALDLVARGNAKVMTETYQLDEANDARERLYDGKVRFRAVLVS